MDQARQLPESDYLRVKALCRRLVKLAGGFCRAAEVTRLNKTHIADCCNPAKAWFLPIDAILDLEVEVGQALVTGELSQMQDELVASGSFDIEALLKLGARIQEELGQFCGLSRQAGEDQVIDDRELDQLIKEADDVLIAARDACETLRRVKAGRRRRRGR